MKSKHLMTTETSDQLLNGFHPDLKSVKELLYDCCRLELTKPKLNAESVEYGACSFKLNGKSVQHRVCLLYTSRCV